MSLGYGREGREGAQCWHPSAMQHLLMADTAFHGWGTHHLWAGTGQVMG